MGQQTDIIDKARAKLGERGVTSGFYDNSAELYKYLTSKRNLLVDELFKAQKELQKTNKSYVIPTLQELYKTVSFNLSLGQKEYSISGTLSITDYKAPYTLEVDTGNKGKNYPAAYMSIQELREKQLNQFDQASYVGPHYSIGKGIALGGKSIFIEPAPIANVTGGGVFKYLPVLPDVTSSVDTGLGTECDNALLAGLLWDAFEQESQFTIASSYQKQFYNLLTSLT